MWSGPVLSAYDPVTADWPFFLYFNHTNVHFPAALRVADYQRVRIG